MTQNLYYHIFGTAREKSLDGSQDNPIFWRTGTPISWDKNPVLKITGGINLFGQFWKIVSKYGQQVSIFSIPSNQYNSRHTGSITSTIPLERTSKNYTYSGTVAESKNLAYDVIIIDIVRVTDLINFPNNPYPVNTPEFPIIPDKDYQTEIQFSNFLLENTGGAEQRIVEWTSPVRVFNLSRTVLKSPDLNAILDFHEEMKGSKKDFLYRDLSDYQVVKGIYSVFDESPPSCDNESPPPPCANAFMLDFEGLQDLEEISDFYNGGTGSEGSSGINYGVSFSANSLAITEDGPGSNFGGLPTPQTASFFLSGSANVMNVAGGFDTGLSFYYSAPFFPGFVNIYDGLDGTGTLLATINLPTTPDGASVPACNGKNFCPFVPIGVAFSGTARSVDFGGSANFIGFDNITIGCDTPLL